VQRGSDALSALAEPFAADDAAFGDRPFRAHLTLARTNRSRDVRAAVTALDACGESEPWTVDDVALFESTGAVHTEIAQFELAG
jgi:2'-5' RNA ligase